VLRCEHCGWELTWGQYFRTIQHKQLSGAEPVLELFRDFVMRFPRAHTPQEKMVLIDTLIHGFHWAAKYGPTRPVAANLIEGRLPDVIRFLDRLTYGNGSTRGIADTRAGWVEKSQNARGWSGVPGPGDDEPDGDHRPPG
jgi:hypothetical protein